MVEVLRNRNCVYQTAYHVIWCPKYRCDVLTGAIADQTDTLLSEVCSERGQITWWAV